MPSTEFVAVDSSSSHSFDAAAESFEVEDLRMMP